MSYPLLLLSVMLTTLIEIGVAVFVLYVSNLKIPFGLGCGIED